MNAKTELTIFDTMQIIMYQNYYGLTPRERIIFENIWSYKKNNLKYYKCGTTICTEVLGYAPTVGNKTYTRQLISDMVKKGAITCEYSGDNNKKYRTDIAINETEAVKNSALQIDLINDDVVDIDLPFGKGVND